MIVLDCVQRGAAWVKARCGVPTASNFHRILTPAKRKASTQATPYLYELLAEWVTGQPHDADASRFMDRGTNVEEWAVGWYELQRDVTTTKVGVILRDDRLVAASPDRLVGDDGVLEIKCPSAAVQIEHLVEGQTPHYCQVQGQLWLSGRTWCDLLSFHPEITPALLRIERDEEFIAVLDEHVSAFVRRMLSERQRLLDLGCKPAETIRVPIENTVRDGDPF